jgi:hypothetical protein
MIKVDILEVEKSDLTFKSLTNNYNYKQECPEGVFGEV